MTALDRIARNRGMSTLRRFWGWENLRPWANGAAQAASPPTGLPSSDWGAPTSRPGDRVKPAAHRVIDLRRARPATPTAALSGGRRVRSLSSRDQLWFGPLSLPWERRTCRPRWSAPRMCRARRWARRVARTFKSSAPGTWPAGSSAPGTWPAGSSAGTAGVVSARHVAGRVVGTRQHVAWRGRRRPAWRRRRSPWSRTRRVPERRSGGWRCACTWWSFRVEGAGTVSFTAGRSQTPVDLGPGSSPTLGARRGAWPKPRR